ncbi:MAG: hypothetical protein H0X17_15010 [Deltaproteobacteria bacterium]|nr:hypothetical protein [Deltaproteobacteria bacterium]
MQKLAISLVGLTLGLGLSLGACKKQETEGGASGGAAATPSGPVKMSAEELVADFSKERKGQEAVAFLNKYRDGVTFTGKVKQVTMMEEDPMIMLDGGNGVNIQLDFADKAAIRAKGVKSDETLTVTCQIGGKNGGLMMASDCKL